MSVCDAEAKKNSRGRDDEKKNESVVYRYVEITLTEGETSVRPTQIDKTYGQQG